MGRLYVKETIGDKTIGYFSNGSVTRGQGIMSDTSTVVKYSGGQIYGNWMGNLLSNQIAYCDEHGNIYVGNGGGSVIAKLENGIVYDASGYGRKEIARYDGDMYGAAAAVAALLLHLGRESTASTSNNESVHTDNSGDSGSSTGGSSESSGCISAVISAVLGMIVFCIIGLWTLLPCILCIFFLVGGAVDLRNDLDGFLLLMLPLLLASVCSICIIYNSRKFKITKKQGHLCRLLNNSGFIIASVLNLWRENLYDPLSIAAAAENREPPALYSVLDILLCIAMYAAPIFSFIYLRKCRKSNAK